jgi:osmoprotectant transport system permease protein
MDFLADLVAWFADPANWQGNGGIPNRVAEHIAYSLFASAVAAAIALPVGLAVGHTGKGGQLAINLANVGRAIPSFGIIILAFIVAGIGLAPPIITLVALAIPPIVTNSYVGIRAVEPGVRDAAEGMGMTGWQVLRRVELPVALPLVMAGLRTATVQVVATATLAAYISLGGLGRYIFDGLAVRDTPKVVAGAILVAGLSLLTEAALSRLQRAVVSPGLQARNAEAAAEAKLSAATT